MKAAFGITALIAAALASGVAAQSVSDVSLQFVTLFTDEDFEVAAVVGGLPVTGTLWWRTLVNGIEAASGTETWNATEAPSDLAAGVVQVGEAGETDVTVEVSLDASFSNFASDSTTAQAIADGVSIVPLLVVLFASITTQMVEVSLALGIFVGACIITGNVVDGFKAGLETYLLEAVADAGHMYVILFTLFLSGLVGLMQKSGGIYGFTKMMLKYAKTSRSAQTVAFFSGLIIFFDDYGTALFFSPEAWQALRPGAWSRLTENKTNLSLYDGIHTTANCLVVGVSMMPLFDPLSISREKLAFIVDATGE